MMRVLKDEKGMTSVGMAVSLLLCLSLVFSSAQIYKVNSASAEIQEVADVCALAAENEVAEFYIAANVCDAAILSMTLLSSMTIGLGIVCACIPPLFVLSEQLISLGSSITRARNNFATAAANGLNGLQKVLPFLAAASALNVAKANNTGAMQANYSALAILVPAEGKQIVLGNNPNLDNLDIGANQNASEIRQNAQAAEEAAEKVKEAKERAYMADCGSAPGRCQVERAQSLSSISNGNNPVYTSVDAWSFNVALSRARAYYAARTNEPEPEGSVADKASYHLRQRFYRYAIYLLSDATFVETPDSVTVNFPKLFRNTNEFRSTVLYTECNYPISGGTIHAYADCPAVGSIDGRASVKQLEEGLYPGCTTCGFEVDSLGNIASASTNVSNGFEYHYEIIRTAANDYQAAMAEMLPYKNAVKNKVDPLIDAFKGVLGNLADMRINPEPPGKNGCIAMVINNATNNAETGFESLFVAGGATLGTRVAVSGAALIEDTSHDASSVITSLLDGFDPAAGGAVGAGRIALDLWSGLLKSYEDGQAAIISAIESALNGIPLLTGAGLGSWAASTLKSAVGECGLQPARLMAKKAVLLNTGYVAASDTGTFAVNYKSAKDRVLAHTTTSNNQFTSVVSTVSDDMLRKIDGSKIVVATIEFPVGSRTIPIEIPLPESIKSLASNAVTSVRDKLLAIPEGVMGIKEWK